MKIFILFLCFFIIKNQFLSIDEQIIKPMELLREASSRTNLKFTNCESEFLPLNITSATSSELPKEGSVLNLTIV